VKLYPLREPFSRGKQTDPRRQPPQAAACLAEHFVPHFDFARATKKFF
jgi:hypothetical protein